MSLPLETFALLGKLGSGPMWRCPSAWGNRCGQLSSSEHLKGMVRSGCWDLHMLRCRTFCPGGEIHKMPVSRNLKEDVCKHCLYTTVDCSQEHFLTETQTCHSFEQGSLKEHWQIRSTSQ